MGDVLVFLEHKHGHYPKSTLVAVSSGLEMARKRGGNCVAVVTGDNCDALVGEIGKYGVSKVIALEEPRLANHLADAAAQALTALTRSSGAETVRATATARGKDLMPTVA